MTTEPKITRDGEKYLIEADTIEAVQGALFNLSDEAENNGRVLTFTLPYKTKEGTYAVSGRVK